MLLSEKTAIVTGSNRGIGRAIITKFAAEGATIFAHARKESSAHLDYCRNLSKTYDVDIYPVYFDAAEEAEIKKCAQHIFSITKDIDILVNNIGVVTNPQLFQMTSMDAMRHDFEINFFSQMYFSQFISRFMARRKTGSIINISSCAGLDGNTGMMPYVASKAAVIGATKRLAIELGSCGIRVNSVAPGLTNTEMGSLMSKELEQQTLAHQIFQRKAEPEEIADAVLFLASDLSRFITGQILRVDGGMLN